MNTPSRAAAPAALLAACPLPSARGAADPQIVASQAFLAAHPDLRHRRQPLLRRALLDPPQYWRWQDAQWREAGGRVEAGPPQAVGPPP